MAASSSKSPVGSDDPKGSASPWNRGRNSGFEWFSPSPSPVEVAELERLFPDIIQAPKQSLQVESDRWRHQAVFVRSLARWIPPEILVREFHRAGISGEIEAIALANRHYLLRFDDATALPLVLGRPWVVNGQPLAITEWKEEFIPAENSIVQALLWIRLPLLPIEFWSDEILASILEVAGHFLYADDATRNRKRGNFARACVAINLSKPFRPGARIRGHGNPFWQQFCYENLEEICSSCGSLHLSGGCGKESESPDQPSSLVYGPWMAAVRRRKPSQGVRIASPSSQGTGLPSSSPSSQSEGWQIPKKVARRQSNRGATGLGSSSGVPSQVSSSVCLMPSSMNPVSNSASGGPAEAGEASGLKLENQVAASVPVGKSRAGVVLKLGKQRLLSPLINSSSELVSQCREGALVSVGKKDLVMVPEAQSLISVPVRSDYLDLPPNPFGGLKPQGVAHSGSVKRARPVETLVQRVASKTSKAKGKAQILGNDSSLAPFTFAASKDLLAGSRVQKARRRDGQGTGSASGLSQPDLVDGSAHDVAAALLKGAISHDCSVMVSESTMGVDGSVTDPSGLPVTSDPIEVPVTGDSGGVPLSLHSV